MPRLLQPPFSAKAGEARGPVQSDLGWHVVKVVSIDRQAGKTLDQAREEIRTRLTADKRKNALTDIVTKVEDAITDQGLNFAEAAALAKLPVTETPLIVAGGTSRERPDFKLPPEYAPALKAGFELQPSDEPVIETLPNDAGYVLVSPARVVPAAPAPLASIRDQVASEWIANQAAQRARAAATSIGTKVGRGIPLAQAVRKAGIALPPVRPIQQRRLELSRMGDRVPAPVRMMFSLGEGKNRMVADPQGRAFFVVKVDKITPGNALLQPTLITQVQNEFQTTLAQEYARQFVEAMRDEIKISRKDSAIAAARKRLTGG